MAKSTSASPQRIPKFPKTQTSNFPHSKKIMVPVRDSKVSVPANYGNVRDGKFFHLRLKLRHLSALSIIQLFSREGGDESMTASTSRWSEADNGTVYATIEIGELHDSNLKYSVSLPLDPSMNNQIVQWPKAHHFNDPTNSSSGRLYHTVLLRTDGASAELNHSEDGSTSTTSLKSPSIYAPILVSIQLGIMRGGKMVQLGVASLEVEGQAVDDLKMDLPVHPISVKKNFEIGKKKGSALKSFRSFLGGSKKKEVPVSKNTTYTPEATFPGDDKLYKIPDNTTLRVWLDIVEGSYDGNGPALWGDMDDDAEPFLRPFVEPMDDGQVDLTDTYSHESIEVMNDKLGTTILSSPGSPFADGDDCTETCTLIAPSNHSESTDHSRAGDDFSAMYAPGGLCGQSMISLAPNILIQIIPLPRLSPTWKITRRCVIRYYSPRR